MPMPVSRTAKDSMPWGAQDTCRPTEPLAVNLSALDNRFLSTWASRMGSVCMVAGTPGSTVQVSSRPFSRAIGRSGSISVCSAVAMVTGSATTVTWPASILDRSRMSLISASRSLPAAWMVCAYLICSACRLPGLLSASSLARIRVEFSGVRSSWLMLARNSLLYWLASSSSRALSVSAPWARSNCSRWYSSCWVCSSRWALVCSSSVCWCSIWVCDSCRMRLCCSSSSLLTRSSSCWACSSSDWRRVSSSKVSRRERSRPERMATASDSEARSSRLRSASPTGRRKPSSITANTSPFSMAGTSISCKGLDWPVPEEICKCWAGTSLTCSSLRDAAAWPASPSPGSSFCCSRSRGRA
ncbi:MAG: hypothetical protein GAK34_02800 [Delftia tsuruhatensis]|nr:MAG: hypothetical protein GAK34_02800 [Delftia tsuruhatensis]